MSIERLQTVLLILGMLFLYFVIMPEQVDQIKSSSIVPTTIPSIAIWIIIVAAGIQFFLSKESIEFNPILCLRAAVCISFIIACVVIMKRFGFEFGSPLLALGIMLGIGERRLHWLFLGSAVIPIGAWLIVEQVLGRILL